MYRLTKYTKNKLCIKLGFLYTISSSSWLFIAVTPKTKFMYTALFLFCVSPSNYLQVCILFFHAVFPNVISGPWSQFRSRFTISNFCRILLIIWNQNYDVLAVGREHATLLISGSSQLQKLNFLDVGWNADIELCLEMRDTQTNVHRHAYKHMYIHTYTYILMYVLCIPYIQNLVEMTLWTGRSHKNT